MAFEKKYENKKLSNNNPEKASSIHADCSTEYGVNFIGVRVEDYKTETGFVKNIVLLFDTEPADFVVGDTAILANAEDAT